MDLRSTLPPSSSTLPPSSNNVLNQIDGGSYQFIQDQQVPEEPILAPFPPTIGVAPHVHMDRPVFTELSLSLLDLMVTQRSQLENYIKFKYDWLSMALLQENNQNLVSLLGGLELKVSILLSQKDEELTRARGQASTLEECLIRGMNEKETWEKIAKDKEAMAMALKRRLQQVQNPSIPMFEEHVGSSTISPQNGRVSFNPCRLCGSCESCMLFIPCRHLCACKNCATFLDACPICHSQKMDGLEILLD